MKGTNTGPFLGLPATGRPVSLPGVDVMEIGTDGIKAIDRVTSTPAPFQSSWGCKCSSSRSAPVRLPLAIRLGCSRARKRNRAHLASRRSGTPTRRPRTSALLTRATATEMLQHGRLHRCVLLQDRWSRCHDLRMGKAGAHEAVKEGRCPFGGNAKVLGRVGRFCLYERVDS